MNRRTILLSPLTLLVAPGIPALAQRPVATPEGYAHPDWLADPSWLEQHLHDDQPAGHRPDPA